MRHSGSTRLALNHVDLITTTCVTALFFFPASGHYGFEDFLFYFDTDQQSRLSKALIVFEEEKICRYGLKNSTHSRVYT